MALLIAALKIIVTMAIQAYLARQDDIEGPGASKLKPESVNTASAEKSIPAFFGKINYENANLLWYGDERQESIYKEVSAGFIADLINGERKIFQGYKYFMGIQVAIGFCFENTPIKIHSIYVDQDVFLFEDENGVTSSRQNINHPNLFGGTTDVPNGWVGDFQYFDGNQMTTSPYLEDKIGSGEVPIYKELAHLVFEANSIGGQPNPKPISFELSHYPVPSFGSLQNAIIGVDYNPAYALYYIMTNKTVGAGINPAIIDTQNFEEVAQQLKDEEIGISLQISNQINFNDFKRTIEDVVAGLLSVNQIDGLYKIKLNRGDYVVDDLEVFTESDISKLNWRKPTTSQLMTELKVAFNNRENNYQRDIAIYSDLGVRYNKQASKSTTLNFDWIKDPETASRLAGRELRTLSYPLTTGSFTTSSKYIDLNRGDVIKLKYGPDEIDLPVRILSIDYGLLEDNKIVVDFSEDFFGRFDSSFSAPPLTKFQKIKAEAIDVNSYYVEAPYFFNKEQFGSNFIIIAEQPNVNNFEYELYTNINGEYELNDVSTFSPTAELNENLNLIDTSITIKNSKLIDRIKKHTVSEIRSGNNILVIQNLNGKEWLSFESITDNMNGTHTLNDLKRGLFQTTVKEFNTEDKVLFVSYGNTYISTLIDGSVNYKLLSKTRTDQLTINEATTVNASENRLNMNNYPVINLKINNERFPSTAPTSGFDLTWSFQNRNEINFFTDEKTYDGNSICSIDIYENGSFVRNEQVSGKNYSYTPTVSTTVSKFIIKNTSSGYADSEEYNIEINLI